MALVPCRQCRQPFYASCADASCLDAVCPYCEYLDMDSALAGDDGTPPAPERTDADASRHVCVPVHTPPLSGAVNRRTR